jgi:hypothetical protein
MNSTVSYSLDPMRGRRGMVHALHIGSRAWDHGRLLHGTVRLDCVHQLGARKRFRGRSVNAGRLLFRPLGGLVTGILLGSWWQVRKR